jgi:phosphopantothenoylcysteine decarboxylase/phosphopantothenate--cysteine ligase
VIEASPATPGVPSFGARRLLVVGTGAVSVAFLPFWVNWLREGYPELELRVVITRSAERFVTRAALTAASGREVLRDCWPDEPELGARHVALAEWADAVAVYPAGMQFCARLALGLADSPALLALQCMSVPIGLAPALPPGGWTSPAFTQHLRALETRANVVVAPPRPVRSITTGREDATMARPMAVLLRLLEQRRLELLGAG